MVLTVLRGLNGQNREGRSLFDKGSTNGEKMAAKRLIKEFPNNTTTSLEYFLLRISYFCGCLWTINIHKSNM